MDPLFRWLESSTLSVWTRESTSVLAYPAILSAHAIGMGLAAGVPVAISLHLLGVGRGAEPTLPTRELGRFVKVMWIGFGLNAVSGVLLLVAYPTKALTNPVFYLKLGLIGLAVAVFASMTRRLSGGDDYGGGRPSRALRALAVASLVCWAAAITAGRLLAYTYRRLLVDF
jgi:hypothetical protein